MHSFLIIGKTEEERRTAAEELIREYEAKEVLRFEPEKDIHSIKSIRELIKMLSTHRTETRAIVLYQANLLTSDAANAFLKTLEEPPENTIIILTSPNRESVLDTIASRCFIKNLGARNLELSDKEKEKALSQFKDLQNGTVGERFKFVDTIKDREAAEEFLIGQIYAAREEMITDLQQTTSNKQQLVDLLDLLVQTRKDLEANVNTKLTLTNLMLHY